MKRHLSHVHKHVSANSWGLSYSPSGATPPFQNCISPSPICINTVRSAQNLFRKVICVLSSASDLHLLSQPHTSPKNSLMSKVCNELSPLPCSGCIGVNDFLLSHYHKLWLIVARLHCKIIAPKLVAHNILTSIIRISPKKQYHLKCSHAWCCLDFTPTWKLGGRKRLSILILPFDLFWAVIKVCLPLRIYHNDLAYNGICETHRLPWPTSMALIKSMELWIYSKACMIYEGKDQYNIPASFTTWQPNCSSLTRGNGQLRRARHLVCSLSVATLVHLLLD